MLMEKQTKLKKEAVLEWFGNKQLFEKFHAAQNEIAMDNGLFIED